mgnify:CR=1 FL=1
MSMTELDSFFLRAAETERKLPAAFRKQKLASWPEFRQEWGAYGWDDFVAPLSKATPADVTCFGKMLGGRDARAVKRMYYDALVRLYYKIPPDDDDEILAKVF